MNNIEQKHKRIETLVKIIGLGVFGFLFAPFALATISGLVSLVIIGIVGLLVVNVLIPWLSVALANWRLKAIKAAAAANPIETLENQYSEKEASLLKIRDNIKETYAIVEELWSQIKEHNERFPNSPSQFQEKYEKLKALVNLRAEKYKKAQKNLSDFAQLIEEKRSDWKIFQAMNKADKLAKVGQDFQSKMMEDTALTTIQDGLNFAFSELEVSLLDEQTSGNNTSNNIKVIVEPPPIITVAQKCLSTPTSLDLDFINKENIIQNVK